MKKFILKAFWLTLPLICAGILADAFLTRNLKKARTADLGVFNDICTGQVNSEVVVYGASRALAHIDPDILADSLGVKAYNLGIDGHNFRLQWLRHRLLLARNTPPRLIIHSVDVHTLERRPDLYELDQFLPYLRESPEVREAVAPYTGFRPIDAALPLVRYYGRTNAILTAIRMAVRPGSGASDRHLGYRGRDIGWNADLDKAKAAMSSYRARLDSGSVELFRAYLEDCKRRNIAVVLVYTPEYIEGQRFEENRQEVFALFKSMSERYRVPFLDYSNDPISFDKKYFYNSSHMNRMGAELFTRELAQALKSDPDLGNVFVRTAVTQ
jgi:hypothetical protein